MSVDTHISHTRPEDAITFRDIKPEDAEIVARFLVTEGRTGINPLPDEFVEKHKTGISDGTVHGVFAVRNGETVGVATYEIGKEYIELVPDNVEVINTGYIAEVVVKRSLANTGSQAGENLHIGSMIFGEAKQRLLDRGIIVQFSIHNSLNLASNGMMEKNGFEKVRVDKQPERKRDMVVHRFVQPPQR